MKELVLKINKMFIRFKRDHITEYAAECAFFTVLSFVPFFMLVLTLIRYTSVSETDLIKYLGYFFPVNMKDYIAGIIKEIYSHSYRTISVAAIFALWSASRGFYALLKGLRTVYKSKGRKVTSIMRTEGILYTILFIFGLVSFFVLVIFGKQLYRTYIKPFVELRGVISFILRIRGLFLILIMTIVFSLIYKFFVPRKKLHFREQIYGAAFASIAWFVLSWIFSVYINIFHGFANLYGSLTTVMLIMMWVYACLYAIFLGAEINVFIMKNIKKSGDEVKQ